MNALAAGLADVVDRDHVRVRGQARRRPRLAPEPSHGASVVLKPRGQQLDRDPAAEDLVLGAPHGRHAAAREVANERVALR